VFVKHFLKKRGKKLLRIQVCLDDGLSALVAAAGLL